MTIEVDERGIPIEMNAHGTSALHAPDKPCQLCTSGTPMSGQDPWEWCKEMDTCAATIDWDKIYDH